MSLQLVIVTPAFGLNFSGGSLATCEIAARIAAAFSTVHVICRQVGEHKLEHLEHHPCHSAYQTIRTLQRFDDSTSVYYGDFVSAWTLALLNKQFVFTYHDNWPMLARAHWKYRAMGQLYWNTYRYIFRHADRLATVSRAAQQRLSNERENVLLIRNGITQSGSTTTHQPRSGILMVGTVDHRKYAMAIKLFTIVEKTPALRVDIYGHVADANIASALRQFSFVTLHGHCEQIPYARYKLLLHTSLMENLSITWCEAISQQTPVLSFDVGGAAEVVTPPFGVTIPPYKLAMMAHRLVSMVQHYQAPPDATDHLSEYDWDKAARSYHDLLLAND